MPNTQIVTVMGGKPVGFPTGASTITVTGTFPIPVAGTGRAGQVIFTPSALLVDSTHRAIYSGGGPVTFDTNGHFTTTLLCTDDPDVQPAGWQWQVDEQPTGGSRRTYWIALPSTLGATTDLAQLAPVSAPDGTGQSLPPTGAAGGALTGAYPNPQLSAATIASFDAAGSASAAQTAAQAYADSNKLSKAANLSDLGSPNTARSNLGLGGAAVLNVGTTTGTVAAGDDSRITGAAQTANNLADLTNAGLARTNLGLGTAATQAASAFDAAGAAAAAQSAAIATAATNAASLYVPATGGTYSGDVTVNGRLSGPIGPYGVIAPSRNGPAWRKASTSFTFQAGHGWTANGAASSNLNNTATPVRGTQYASITTNTAGGSANLRKFAMPTMDLTGKAIRLICRVDNVANVAFLNFFVGTSSLGNTYKWTLWETTSASQPGSSGEWITLTFGWSSLNSAFGSYTVSSTGVPSTTSGFTDLEVQAIATNGTAITLDVQAIEFIDATATTFPSGVVSIVFDDGDTSIWNYGRPAMDTYGYQGTNYVIVGNLNQPNYMTTAQSKSMQDFSGWEIGLHSYDPTMHTNRYTTYTAAQVDTDIRLGKQWLVSNGFRGEAIAYPGGEYQTTTDGAAIDAIAARYFSNGRTVLFQTGYPTETFPAGMPMRVRAVSSISSTQVGANNPANLVAAGGLLDKCQLNSGWLILVFHKIVTGTPGASTECSQSDFQMIMAGINSRGIPVVPISDVMRLYS